MTFAPKDVTPVDFTVKDNVHGLGYRGLDPRQALFGSLDSHVNLFGDGSDRTFSSLGDVRHSKGRKVGISGQVPPYNPMYCISSYYGSGYTRPCIQNICPAAHSHQQLCMVGGVHGWAESCQGQLFCICQGPPPRCTPVVAVLACKPHCVLFPVQAFGVGALEDEDDDIYGTDSMSKYDTVLKEESGDNLFGWTAPKEYRSKKGND